MPSTPIKNTGTWVVNNTIDLTFNPGNTALPIGWSTTESIVIRS